ncbi:hypothetical protein [Flexithrix dorotheae]|uniref:hypothetical protein n=1 Tax=Flexithrix dorotheae TaxID=70993 RepID=UPI001FE0AD8E|nr:hypothetical protein [Flexithrix dorotheae]
METNFHRGSQRAKRLLKGKDTKRIILGKMATQVILNRYKSINPAVLSREVKEELVLMENLSKQFSDQQVLSHQAFQDNFNDLYEVIEELHPTAIQNSAKKEVPKKITRPLIQRAKTKKTNVPKSKEKKGTRKQVPNFTESERQIRKFLSWQQKVKSRTQIRNAAVLLNKKGVTEIFDQKNKPLLRNIYRELEKTYNGMLDKRQTNITIKFSKTIFQEMQSVMEQLEILPSVRLIIRYLNLQGKEGITKKSAELLKKSIEKAISNRRVLKADKYFEKLKTITRSLKDFIGGNKESISLQKESLAGLSGIPGVHLSPPTKRKKPVKKKARSVKTIKKSSKKNSEKTLTKNKTMTIESDPKIPDTIKPAVLESGGFVLAHQPVTKPPTFKLAGEMGKFLGELQPYKLAITVSGNRGGGKTTLVTQLIDAFLDTGKKVGFFSLEQGGMESKDTEKLVTANIKAKNRSQLAISGEAEKGIETVKKFASVFDCVVIDSWQKLQSWGANTRFDELRSEFPNTIFIVIFQQNALGGTKGGVAAEFDAPVVLKVVTVDPTFVRNYAIAEKNRGNSLENKYLIAAKKTVLLFTPKLELSKDEDEKLLIDLL